jgi:hypothetical protein
MFAAIGRFCADVSAFCAWQAAWQALAEGLHG